MVRRRVRVTLTVRVARLPCRLRQNIAVTNEISDRYTDFVLWQEHGAPLVSMSNHYNTIVKFKAALKTAKKGGSTNQNQMAFAANVYQDVRGERSRRRSRRTFAANVRGEPFAKTFAANVRGDELAFPVNDPQNL